MQRLVAYEKDLLLSFADCGNPDGYPLLIQHGLIASIRDGELFERLSQAGLRLISIARPGYGESSPYVMPNLAAWGRLVAVVVDELKLAQFDVLGISSGAPYSYAISQALPERVRNIFILSGIPALYDSQIVARWPYEVDKTASLSDLQALAHELFFSNLSPADLQRNDVRDSMMNDCFGPGQDFKLRSQDWGFELSEVRALVRMQHSRADSQIPLVTAEMTARLLPNCRLEIREGGEHFSRAMLDDFFERVMAGYYSV